MGVHSAGEVRCGRGYWFGWEISLVKYYISVKCLHQRATPWKPRRCRFWGEAWTSLEWMLGNAASGIYKGDWERVHYIEFSMSYLSKTGFTWYLGIQKFALSDWRRNLDLRTMNRKSCLCKMLLKAFPDNLMTANQKYHMITTLKNQWPFKLLLSLSEHK